MSLYNKNEISNLISKDFLEMNSFVLLDNNILDEKSYRIYFNEIVEIANLTNYIKNYDDFPSRKFEYPFAISATELKPKMKVADMGCSIDPFAPVLAKNGLDTYGLDVFASHDESWDPVGGFRNGKFKGLEKMRKYSSFIKEHLSFDLNYLNEDMSSTSFSDNFLDRIFCISVLEHLPAFKISIVLDEWRRILKKDGLVILTIDYIDGLTSNFNIGHMLQQNNYRLHGKIYLFPSSNGNKKVIVAGFVISPNSHKNSLFSSIYRKYKFIRIVCDYIYELTQKVLRKLKL